mgnify:CR=1 FL=1
MFLLKAIVTSVLLLAPTQPADESVFPLKELSGSGAEAVVIEGTDGEFYLVLPVGDWLSEGGAGRPDIDPGTGTWSSFKCNTALMACPAGPIRGTDGNYTGCTNPSPGVCGGTCTDCAGAPTSLGHWCRNQADETCFIGASNTTFACGAATPRACTGTVPVPPPPAPLPDNNCYCNGTPGTSSNTCKVKKCTP